MKSKPHFIFTDYKPADNVYFILLYHITTSFSRDENFYAINISFMVVKKNRSYNTKSLYQSHMLYSAIIKKKQRHSNKKCVSA